MPHAGESLARVGQLGVLQSLSGQVVANNATATPFFSVPSTVNGTFVVSVGLTASDPTNYSAVSIVSCDGTTLRTTNLQTAALMSVSVSGSDIRATQGSGAPQTVYWSVTRLS